MAFAIAALALGVMYSSGLGALHSTQVASRYDEAVSRARSHLALAVHAIRWSAATGRETMAAASTGACASLRSPARRCVRSIW